MGIQAKDIRNVVFAGHASKGKTTLCEALLNVAGTTERIGKTGDGNTVWTLTVRRKRGKSALTVLLLPLNIRVKILTLLIPRAFLTLLWAAMRV